MIPDIHASKTYIIVRRPHAEHSARGLVSRSQTTARGPEYEARKQRLDITVQLKRAMARQHYNFAMATMVSFGIDNRVTSLLSMVVAILVS